MHICACLCVCCVSCMHCGWDALAQAGENTNSCWHMSDCPSFLWGYNTLCRLLEESQRENGRRSACRPSFEGPLAISVSLGLGSSCYTHTFPPIFFWVSRYLPAPSPPNPGLLLRVDYSEHSASPEEFS